jgi:hypothetical protein
VTAETEKATYLDADGGPATRVRNYGVNCAKVSSVR